MLLPPKNAKNAELARRIIARQRARGNIRDVETPTNRVPEYQLPGDNGGTTIAGPGSGPPPGKRAPGFANQPGNVGVFHRQLNPYLGRAALKYWTKERMQNAKPIKTPASIRAQGIEYA